MPRLLTNPRFWMLTFVVTWLVVITLLVAVGPEMASGAAGGR
jgi:hypothetical protein